VHISKKSKDVVDILESVGLLHQAKGFYNRGQNDGYPKGRGKLTRIWPSYALREMFKASGIDPKTIGHHPDCETVILRDDEGNDIEYEDIPFTIDLRAFLNRYNELLQIKEITHPKHQCSSFTVSIFNDESWEKGGRFYNDWMFIKSEDRMDLILDGEPTIEIDFSANHPYLIYAERCLMSPWSFPENAVEDPYYHEGFNRAQIKKMFQVMNNSSSEAEALRGYEDPETGKNNLRLEHTRPILEAVKEKHSEIVDYFFLNKGLELMRKEAEVARGIMERFVEADKPILPIHDSFVVQASQTEFLKDAMYEALKEVVGNDVIYGPTGLPPIKVKRSEKVAPCMPPGTRGPEGLVEWNTILRIVWPRVT